MQRQRLILIIAVIAALCAGFGGGYGYFRQQNAQNVDAIIKQVINKDQGKVAAVDFSLFWQVWDKLHDRFVDKEKLD